ncbi:MAG: biopolymer transporter ExbD [Prevotella sp.]|nr:biopolymer transporter ExbD [Prevotella sp.]
MSIIRHKTREIPALNTASLPDLIFTVLFFFMIVTHMRTVNLKVRYQTPQGTELARLTKKTATTHIYIGERILSEGRTGINTVIQMNDKIVTPEELTGIIAAERKRMLPEDRLQMIVSIKADRATPVGLITEVKQALRKANALHISYTATETKKKSTN